MKLKNTKTVVLFVLAMIFSVGSYAVPTTEATPVTAAAAEAEMQIMVNRLEEIKAMDLENMPRSEKRKYAKEVRHIQKQMKKTSAIGGGVYISAGALLVIVLIIILLV